MRPGPRPRRGAGTRPRRTGRRSRRRATQNTRTGGQLESWPWMRIGTISVTGGPGSVIAASRPRARYACIALTVRSGESAERRTMVAEIVVIVIVAAIVIAVVWKSFHSIGATEVGLVAKRFALPEARRGQPDRVPRRSGIPGDAAHARVALQAVAALRREEVPVGAGARGRDRRRHRAGRRPAADRREERGVQAGARELLQPRTASWSKAARRACSVRCCLPGTLVPIHPVAFLVLTAQTVYGLPVSPDLAGQSKDKTLSPASFGLSPDQLRVVVIAPDAAGSTWSAW